MRRLFSATFFAIIFSLSLSFPTSAQDSALRISMRRDFGYSSGGGDIQGLFSITASGPGGLSRVVFYIDEKVIGEVRSAPFTIQFNTDNYPQGVHQIYAVGFTNGTTSLTSQSVTANFVSADAGWQATVRIAGPILGVTVLAILFSVVVPLLASRKTEYLPAGTPRSYPMGGAICPNCKRPFALHIYGMNLLTHKYDRCPYCRKWNLVARISFDRLRDAEQAELAAESAKASVPEMSEDEKLKKDLEESRYQ